MPVVIRLSRIGAKGVPQYRITVADSRRFVKSKFLEIIGNFSPNASGKQSKLVLDMAKAKEWIKKGAQPSLRVKSLMRQAESGTN